MAITSSIDIAARIVRLAYSEEVSPQEWTKVMLAVCEEPSFQPGFGFLVDRRGVEERTTACVEQVLKVVEIHRETLAAGPWALVVSDSQAAFGMARMLEMLAQQGPMRLQVFRDIGEAERWLRASHGGWP